MEGRGEMLLIRVVGRAVANHGCNGDKLGVGNRRGGERERVEKDTEGRQREREEDGMTCAPNFFFL